MKCIRVLFLVIFFICNIMLILRIFGIAVFISAKDIFWGVYVCSLITWAILIYRKRKVVLFIIPLCLHSLLFALALFRIGGIGHAAYITKIVSPSEKNTVIIKEFDKPVHGGCAIYKKCFLNIYYMTYLIDLETNYFPFSEETGTYKWSDEDTVQLSFPYSKGSEKHKTVTVTFG